MVASHATNPEEYLHRPISPSESIPTLAELLDSLPKGLELNIHTYPAEGDTDIEPLCQAVVQEIQNRGLHETRTKIKFGAR